MVNSDQPENVDLGVAAQAKRIAAFLTALGWSNGTLVGHDIGGGIAQLIAVDCRAISTLKLLRLSSMRSSAA
jgi:pimeloyl-ACP methyl ester carboxylesterase